MISFEDGAGCECVDDLIRIGENSVAYLHVLLVEALTFDRT